MWMLFINWLLIKKVVCNHIFMFMYKSFRLIISFFLNTCSFFPHDFSLIWSPCAELLCMSWMANLVLQMLRLNGENYRLNT